MRSLLYVIAVLLIIGWALGSFAWHTANALIHLLLVVAVIMILFNLISGRRRPID
ncbi:lmo0937 family membrane protein [Flavobacterium sp. RNTU_13]|uniref:lmo0937 family membrane protein n=1 Tax=Flavobacterium sp. RNTU_13 TaxID=3375145 RepID=UPI003985FD55